MICLRSVEVTTCNGWLTVSENAFTEKTSSCLFDSLRRAAAPTIAQLNPFRVSFSGAYVID